MYRALRVLTRPVVAAVLFNTMVVVTHIPGVVNNSVQSAPLHYTLHFLLVMVALVMWMPVVGPFPELQLSYGAKMIYLFAMSVIPVIPAGWLTFADGAVYSHYGHQAVRVWNMSPTDDQQIAALVMQVGGGYFLWSIIIYMYFRRFSKVGANENSYRRVDEPPLTYSEVEGAFGRSAAPAEPSADRRLQR